MRIALAFMAIFLLALASCVVPQTTTTQQDEPHDERAKNNPIETLPAVVGDHGVDDENHEATEAQESTDETVLDAAETQATEAQVTEAAIEEVAEETAVPVEEVSVKAQTSGEPVEYQPYSKEAYEAALASGKVVFLEFYAPWCPSCNRQKPETEKALASYVSSDVMAFEVDYDSQTDLKKEHNIIRQNTKVIIGKDGKQFHKTLNHLTSEEIASLLDQATA